MLVSKKTNIYFAIEISLREIFFRCVPARANLRALMTRKSCAVGMRNAILRNHLKDDSLYQYNNTAYVFL